MTIGSDAIGRTPNDLQVLNTLGVGTDPSPDSVAIFKASFSKQLPNLATSNPVLVGGFREITSVDHGLMVGSPLRIPSGAGGAFEDREVIFVDSDDIFRLWTDITNQITDKQILSSPDIAQFEKPLTPAAFGIAGFSSYGSIFFGKISEDAFFEFRAVVPGAQPSFFAKTPSTGVFNFDMIIGNQTGAATWRFFRQTITTGGKAVTFVHETGSGSTTQIKLGINGQGTFFHPDAGNFGIGTTATPASHQLEVVGDTKLDGAVALSGVILSGAANITSSVGAYRLAVTNTLAPRTVTLSSADALIPGNEKLIQDESGGANTNNITLNTEGSQTINNVATQTINLSFGNIVVYANNSGNWVIKSRI